MWSLVGFLVTFSSLLEYTLSIIHSWRYFVDDRSWRCRAGYDVIIGVTVTYLTCKTRCTKLKPDNSIIISIHIDSLGCCPLRSATPSDKAVNLSRTPYDSKGRDHIWTLTTLVDNITRGLSAVLRLLLKPSLTNAFSYFCFSSYMFHSAQCYNYYFLQNSL